MDKKDIYELMDRFQASDLTELTWEQGKDTITLKREVGQVVVPQQPVSIAAPAQTAMPTEGSSVAPVAEEVGQLIAAPIVGTFYRAASPDAPPYVETGKVVKKGETICIIEAMKSMNEIPAEFDFEVLDVLVENGVPIEFDAPLFRVKPL